MSPPPAGERRASGEREAGGLVGATLRGAAWVGASRIGGKLLFFACTLLLARWLDREDFGVAAYAITLIALFGSVPGLGLAPALIHHRDDAETLDTGFWLGVAAGCLAFALVWAAAPLSGWIFGDDRAIGVTRALGLVFPLEALRNVHATLLRKRLAFRRRFVPEMVQSTAKGLVAIGLALAGFGHWSLIWGSVAATALGIPVYWIVSGWRPGLRFRTAAASRLLPFGGHIVAVDLLGAFVRNLDYLLVGRLLGAATLGVYTLAFRIPDLLIRDLCLTLGQVLLPVYANAQGEPATIRSAFRATTAYVAAVTAPMAIGLALVAEPLVITAFSDKWREMASVLPPICAYAFFVSLAFNLGDLYKALGRPELLTRLSILRACIAAPAIGFAAGVVGTATAVGWAQALVAGIALVANFTVARAVLGLPVGSALARILPIGMACGVMAAAVVSVAPVLETSSAATQLLACSLVGAAAYAAALRLLAREFCEDGVRALLEVLSRRRVAAGAAP
jgi:PST family polysaccharide transporter